MMSAAQFLSILLSLMLSFAVHNYQSAASVPNSWLRLLTTRVTPELEIEEVTVADIQSAFKAGWLNSTQLVSFYLNQISSLNPQLRAVLEVNPDALSLAAEADRQRTAAESSGQTLSPLQGIPVLVKDSISTLDRLNTTSCSFSLLGSAVARDAGVIQRLRSAGAIILGKATMSEWDNFRSVDIPQGWCARGGQAQNPYPGTNGPCGTSSGSAIAVTANLVTVALASDLDGAITCPAAATSVVGIKPTVGITSRSGMVPISLRLDTIGTMGRTVADAVALLDAITGFDPLDANATEEAERFVPTGGFESSLKPDGLKGRRLGILRSFFNDEFPQGTIESNTFEAHFQTMRSKGAILIENLELNNTDIMLNRSASGEAVSLVAEFKLALNDYLKDLVSSPVRSLADVIAFNNEHPVEERLDELGQIIFLASENTNGIGEEQKLAIEKMAQLSKDGMEFLIKGKELDAVVFPDASATTIMALGGFPIVNVPAGFNDSGTPFSISFAGLMGSDATLIEIAYAFEQVTKVRKPPPKPY